MISLANWHAHLKEKLPGIDVSNEAALATAKTQQPRDRVFVVPLDDRAEPSQAVGPARQMLTSGVAIILAVKNLRGRAAGISEVEQFRGQVRNALLGWEPCDAAGSVSFREGRLLELTDGLIWWQDVYETQCLITQAQTASEAA